MRSGFKRFALPILFLGAVGLGVMQYLGLDGQGKTAERAVDAVMGAFDAASEWATDRSERRIELVAVVGRDTNDSRISPVVVQTSLTMRGPSRLARVCETLPHIRNSVNLLMLEMLHDRLRAGRADAAGDLASYEESLKVQLNRLYGAEVVAGVRFTVGRQAELGESGCSDRKAARG